MTDPAPGELLRRLQDVAAAQERTVSRLDEMIRTLDEKYVPRREYELRTGELEKDAATQSAFRRQVAGGALVGIILLLANVVLVLTRIPGVA